jgi:hypothetical protein
VVTAAHGKGQGGTWAQLRRRKGSGHDGARAAATAAHGRRSRRRTGGRHGGARAEVKQWSRRRKCSGHGGGARAAVTAVRGQRSRRSTECGHGGTWTGVTAALWQWSRRRTSAVTAAYGRWSRRHTAAVTEAHGQRSRRRTGGSHGGARTSVTAAHGQRSRRHSAAVKGWAGRQIGLSESLERLGLSESPDGPDSPRHFKLGRPGPPPSRRPSPRRVRG